MEEKSPELKPLEKDPVLQQSTDPQVSAPNHPDTLDVKVKEAKALSKKKRFKKILFVFILIVLIMILVPIIKGIYTSNLENEPVVVQDVEEEDRTLKIDQVDAEKKVQANSDSLRLNLEYLEEGVISENDGGGIKKLEIIYAPLSSAPGGITEFNLDKGYIFRVSSFMNDTREIEEITKIKSAYFASNCPETAEISNITSNTVSVAPSYTFDVYNCNGDYKINYVYKFGNVYEFMQFFKGDFGYKQRYRAETEDILRSINFYPEEEPKEITTFTSDQYKFSFDYPTKLSSDCCSITDPGIDKSENLITLGNPETVINQNSYDGFGIFVEKLYNTSFEDYLELQKKTLIDDYVVVKGKAPEPKDIVITVGDKKGLMLKDYSWRENDIIIVDISTGNSLEILLISVVNVSGDSFTETFNTILRSFVFE